MSPILDAFQDLRLEKLSAYARKWVEGPYDPRKRGPAWNVPIKAISLYKPIPSRGPGGYIVVFELVENEHSLTYQAAKDAEWEYGSPIPMPNGFDALSKDEQDIVRHHLDDVGMTRTGKTLSAEHSEINKLTTACGMGCTNIDYSQLMDKDFVRLVYRPEVVAASDEKALRDEWRFHVLFPGEHMPEWIDEEGPIWVLWPVCQEQEKPPEKISSTQSLPTSHYALLNLEPHWKLVWNGKETISRQGGWKYIHHCMLYPEQVFTNIELDKLFNPQVSATVQSEPLKEGFTIGDLRTLMDRSPILDQEAKAQIEKHLKELEAEIEEHERTGRSEQADELRAEKEEIEDLMTECVQRGQVKVHKDTQTLVDEKINQAVRRAIQRLDLEPERYFSQAFNPINSSKKCYNPEKPIDFRLK